MRWTDVVWEVARAVYSIGLLALGVVLLRSVPAALRVIRELTAAQVAAAEALRAWVLQRDPLERIETQGRENADALRRIEAAVSKDK